MAFDVSKATEHWRQDVDAAGTDLADAGSPIETGARPSGDETQREVEYERAIRALIDRTCGLMDEEGKAASPGTTEDATAMAVDEILPASEPTPPANADDGSPLPSRAASTETAADIEKLREVARSMARQAIGQHRFRVLLSSAWEKLLLAMLALLGSAGFQALGPRPFSEEWAVALVAWLAGAVWAVQYFSATRQLSKLCSSTFHASEET